MQLLVCVGIKGPLAVLTSPLPYTVHVHDDTAHVPAMLQTAIPLACAVLLDQPPMYVLVAWAARMPGAWRSAACVTDSPPSSAPPPTTQLTSMNVCSPHGSHALYR